ncbi:MAG: hypothetical protein J7J98_06195 [candidate division Zixibacteria bacterium]|nr:hypothetical protein [candidate division Zixibacteria bacterium]
MRTLESRLIWIVVATALVLYVTIGLVFLRTWSTADYWEHLAVIGAFAGNLLQPENPYTGPGNLTHLFTPYHLFWGLVVRLTGLHPIHLTPVVGLTNVVMFLVACRAVSRRFLGDSKYATATCLVLLLAWVIPWEWSGFYNFGMLPGTIVYPYWFAFPLALIIVSRYAESDSRSWGWLVAFGFGAALTFAIHPITGAFLFLSMVLKALLERDVGFPIRLGLIGTVVGAALLPLLWPYFPVMGAILASSRYEMIGFESNYYQFYENLHVRMLPGILAVPAICTAIKSRKFDFLTLGLAVFGLIFAANYVTTRSAVGGRLIVFVIFFLQILIVRSLIMWRGTRYGAIIVLLSLFIVGGAGSLQARASLNRLILVSGDRGPSKHRDSLIAGTNFEMLEQFQAMSEHLSTKDVVLSYPMESWVLPSLLGCRVVTVAHANPFMEDFTTRKNVVRRFFSFRMSKAETIEFFNNYRITHALITKDSYNKLSALLPDYKLEWSSGGYVLLSLTNR